MSFATDFHAVAGDKCLRVVVRKHISFTSFQLWAGLFCNMRADILHTGMEKAALHANHANSF
jgi:hypothetical protein